MVSPVLNTDQDQNVLALLSAVQPCSAKSLLDRIRSSSCESDRDASRVIRRCIDRGHISVGSMLLLSVSEEGQKLIPPKAIQQASNSDIDQRHRLGDRVRIVADLLPATYREDWRHWEGYVCGIEVDTNVPGGVNITVSDYWPPHGNGDRTDGFTADQIVSAPTFITKEDRIAAGRRLDDVAKAIFDAMPHNHPNGRKPDWAAQPTGVRNTFLRHARAAIDAIESGKQK